MTIETTLEIENNDGEFEALEIVAEYEPAEAPQIVWGIQTEAGTLEKIKIKTVSGECPDLVWCLRFNESYTYKHFYRKLNEAVREQFDREVQEYGF